MLLFVVVVVDFVTCVGCSLIVDRLLLFVTRFFCWLLFIVC